jgi:hypothetical protein
MVEFSGQNPPLASAYSGTVVDLAGEVITFRDVRDNKEQTPINFAGAEIQLHSYDPINSTNAFVALWAYEYQSVICVLTEMRPEPTLDP